MNQLDIFWSSGQLLFIQSGLQNASVRNQLQAMVRPEEVHPIKLYLGFPFAAFGIVLQVRFAVFRLNSLDLVIKEGQRDRYPLKELVAPTGLDGIRPVTDDPYRGDA